MGYEHKYAAKSLQALEHEAEAQALADLRAAESLMNGALVNACAAGWGGNILDDMQAAREMLRFIIKEAS